MGEATLVAMRLRDMRRVHPQQIDDRVCSRCGEAVGIYPSGQQALRAHPEAEIVCHICAGGVEDVYKNQPAAPMAEIAKEIAESEDREP